ncbi:hypothetical protein HOY80DRAFT_897643 [Tuber brumale]|nr:hypothetical protein HOY80DRAFT_897643 [Tuber brumale]
MLFISSTLLLLVNAVTLRRERSILFNRVAVLILLYSGIICYDSLNITSLDTGIGIYGGLFHSTSITHSFDLFICIIGAIMSSMATAAVQPELNTLKKERETLGWALIPEYPLVILFILIGAIFLMSSSDLVSMFLAIELQSYGLYIFATLYRNSELATSAGLTYFLLGGLSSCFILLGSCLLYLNFGITNLDGLYVLSSLSEVNGLEVLVETNQYFNLALLIMSVGYLFKVSAAPFHV